MEVPHHPHTHESKGWKSYIGEFLMLFLAVFSGFIAENLREHYVDKEKEHQYITSMISDLRKDTLELTQTITLNRKIIRKIDTLLVYLKAPKSDSITKKIYAYSNYVGIYLLYSGSNGTITQLKNAGGLRLIRDTASVNRITEYDQFNEALKQQGGAYSKSALEMLTFLAQILDFSAIGAGAASGPMYLNRNPDKLMEFYNKCYIQKQLIGVYCSVLEVQKKESVKDMALLKKNYHLD